MKPKVLLGLAAAFVAGASCTEILGLDIIFVDPPGGGGAGAGGAGGAGGASTISSGSGGQGGGVGGGAGEGGASGCAVGLGNASDSFLVDGGVGWCRLEPTPMESVVFENNGVTLRAYESAWYDDSAGPFVYRNIAKTEGDFVVVARLEVTDGVGGDVTTDRHGGGLMVRTPNPMPGSDEQWVRLSLTYLNGFGAKWYSTNGASTTSPAEYQYGAFSVIAICKDAPLFYFFAYDETSSTWLPVFDGMTESTQHMALTNAELLQVGVASHVDIVVPGEVVTRARYIDFLPVDGTCIDALNSISAPLHE